MVEDLYWLIARSRTVVEGIRRQERTTSVIQIALAFRASRRTQIEQSRFRKIPIPSASRSKS